ncbi:hypothetical protein VTK56DRAFT_463 [Thermocarpiscus australiensis]
MLLKRKRSESELSFGSTFSSPPRPDSSCFNFEAIAALDAPRTGFLSPRLSTPLHLPSRTMKRFRNNRPPDSEVHRHTLDLLYSAQHRHQESHHEQPQLPTNPSATTPVQIHTQSHRGVKQRSLLSFWNLPANSLAPSSPASPAVSSPAPGPTHRDVSTSCEDCGAELGAGEDSAMMDVDGLGFAPEDCTCGACGKAVCFSCSISNLGEHRRCLACAGRRDPVAGPSWMTGYGIC